MPTCQECSRTFDTERGLNSHVGKMHDPLPKEKLVELYVRQTLSPQEIAGRIGISHSAVKSRITKYDLWGKASTKFHLEENGMSGPFAGYPRWTHTGTGQRVRVHRLQAIAAGADPHEVFGNEKSVDHINGCPLDNREENLRLMDKKIHGRKDGERSDTGHSHAEYLQALVQKPPEWAQKLRESDDPGCDG